MLQTIWKILTKSKGFLFFGLLCLTTSIEAQLAGRPRTSTILANGQTPCVQDFEDFIAFAQAFGSKQGDPNFNFRADYNSNGTIDFSDFIFFAQSFGSDQCPSQFFVSGRVALPDTVLSNVGLELLGENLQFVDRQKTSIYGDYQFENLEEGTYFITAKKFGYAFTPDTLQIQVSNDDIKLPDIQAQLLYTLIDVKVLQNDKPISGVEVAFSRLSDSLTLMTWKGITDSSGVAAIRITAQNHHVEGLYQVTVIAPPTASVLDTWTNITIQEEDTRRLILPVDSTAYYVPEREYFYFQGNQKHILTPSDRELRVRFRDDVLPAQIDSLLAALDLRKGESYFGPGLVIFQNTQGRGAVLEALNILKRSGLVLSVLPNFSKYSRVYIFEAYIPQEKLIVKFKASASEAEINALNEAMSATVEQEDETGEYHLKISDLLMHDIFEVAERYRNHPIVESAIISAIRVVAIP